MSRALARFTVTHGACRIRVRVLPTDFDVDSDLRAGARPRRDGKLHPAFFQPPGERDAHDGTIVLAANARLTELVPHEVSHAVIHRYGVVESCADEPVATAIGLISARIFDRLRRLGVTP